MDFRAVGFRPFRAGLYFDVRTQGVALGYHLAPRWGKRQETGDRPHTIGSRSYFASLGGSLC